MSEEWRDGLSDADTLVSAVMARNAVEPGYAKAILRALGAKLVLADIRASAPPANVDVNSLIG